VKMVCGEVVSVSWLPVVLNGYAVKLYVLSLQSKSYAIFPAVLEFPLIFK